MLPLFHSFLHERTYLDCMCVYVRTYVHMYVCIVMCLLLLRCSSLNSSATTKNSLKRISRCVSAYIHTCNGSTYVRTYVQIMPCKSVLKCLTASVTKHTLQSHCHEDGACLSNEFTLSSTPTYAHAYYNLLCMVVVQYVRTCTCMHTYVCMYKFVFYSACVRFALV